MVVEFEVLDCGCLGVVSSERGLRNVRREIGSGELSFIPQ